MMKLFFRLSLALLLVMTCCSCVTPRLYRDVRPNERVFISSSEITEAELIKKGVQYEKYDHNEVHGYLVKKEFMRQLGDYAVLTLATPVAIAVDGALFAVTAVVWLTFGGLSF